MELRLYTCHLHSHCNADSPCGCDPHVCLQVIQQLVLDRSPHASDDLAQLLQKLQSVPPEDTGAVRLHIIRTFLRVFSIEPRTKAAFFDSQGVVCVVSTLLTLHPTDSGKYGVKERGLVGVWVWRARDCLPCHVNVHQHSPLPL